MVGTLTGQSEHPQFAPHLQSPAAAQVQAPVSVLQLQAMVGWCVVLRLLDSVSAGAGIKGKSYVAFSYDTSEYGHKLTLDYDVAGISVV